MSRAVVPSPAEPVAAAFDGREFGFTRRDFRRIVEMLHADAGIRLTESKAPLVYGRLVRRLREIGVESFARYCALVESEAGAAERQQMLAALTTNVTSFFREPHHFRHLASQVLPDLIEQARAGRRVRLWSAACSTGEEPYSIALSILERAPDAARYDIRVLATDLNAHVLAVGQDGEYDETALRPVSRTQRSQWFTTAREADGRRTWRVGEALRTLVAFRQLNLLEPWPMRASYQAIFCRNVLIYFDESDQTAVQRRLTGQLAPSGWLYLGATERVRDVADLHAEGPTIYRRQADAPGQAQQETRR